MPIILIYIKHLFEKTKRNLYWFYRLNKIKKGKKLSIQFPVKVEGGGSISLKNNCSFQKRVNLGVSRGAKLSLGNCVLLKTKSTILVNRNCELNILNNFKLGSDSRLYINNNSNIGNDVTIETNCAIFSRESKGNGKLTIGDRSAIGDFTIIDLVSDVSIGQDVAIGPNCTIYSHDHIYTDKNLPAWKGGLISKPVSIQDGAWIGSGVTILPGVTIGRRAVVAAGSVVTKSLEGNAIYGGIPAKLIKRIK